MQLVIQTATDERELELSITRRDASVGDLIDALGEDPPPPGIVVSGAFIGREQPLEDACLYCGAVVRLAALGQAGEARSTVELLQVGGLNAGRRFPLLLGRAATVGRGADCDVVIPDGSVSRRHCQVVAAADGGVTISDLSSANGTYVDGRHAAEPLGVAPDSVIQIGDVQLRVRSGLSADRPLAIDPRTHTSPDGTISFNRPPRGPPLPSAALLAVPVPPRTASSAPFSLASLLAPLVFGAVMVVVLKNALYAMFAVLSPMMMLGNWYESRYRTKRSLRREMREYSAGLAELRFSAARERALELARRRQTLPDIGEVIRRASEPSVRLWERRRKDPDFLELSAGFGNLQWRPTLASDRASLPNEIEQLLLEHANLPLAPVQVVLSGGGVVGIVGARDATLALVRGLLCQAATHQGPADLSVAVATSEKRAGVWDWTKWLPHVWDPGGSVGERLLAAGREQSNSLLGELLRRKLESKNMPVTLVVLDDEGLTEGRNAPARALLQRGDSDSDEKTAGIVIAESEDRLPAACNVVITLSGREGAATLRRPQTGERVDSFLAAGVSEPIARQHARALARYEDPDLRVGAGGLPGAIALAALLKREAFDGQAIARVWEETQTHPGASAPIGVSEKGTFAIDLVRHGPHGLIGGTTGSGKSELLRTLVLALAVQVSPDGLTFVLLDFKGGATFDELGRLPHTVGLATDLDEHLAERALRCLHAELRFRERLFRQTEVGTLDQYREVGARTTSLQPLPRLVVIIDEFAEMAGALPDFLQSLVGIARRGRSLGVHLILATQKPAGAVNAEIRTNTDLKIALRVQDDADSVDVIGVSDASRISRALRGRAYIKLGHGDIIPVQTAYASGITREESAVPLRVGPFVFGRAARPTISDAAKQDRREGPTDLTRTINAINDAFSRRDHPPPRRPWTDPLPTTVSLTELRPLEVADPDAIAIALADDPDAQDQYPWSWNPDDGNLLLYGIGGSGTTTALGVIALSAARSLSADDVHLYVLDFGAGELACLAQLPHTGAAVGPGERERQLRLIRHLRSELERRRSMNSRSRDDEPTIILLLDNYGAFRSEFAEIAYGDARDALERVYADGPEVGIHVAMSADRSGAIPNALANLTKQKLVFRLADKNEYGGFGIAARLMPAFCPGRALVAETKQEVQVAWPGVLAQAVEQASLSQRPSRPAPQIGVLPDAVEVEQVAQAALAGDSSWFVPIGIGDRDLTPAGLTLHQGDHVLIAGPPRSGKSTTLLTVARTIRHTATHERIAALAMRPSTLRQSGDIDRLAVNQAEATALLEELASSDHGFTVLIDDADQFEDQGGVLKALLTGDRTDFHVWAAARADAIARYGHWTELVRRARLGVLLQPNPDRDGDLLGARLPRHETVRMRAGRGYLVGGGTVELVQVARA